MSKQISYLRAFFSVCVHPRETVRQLIEQDPGYGIWLLVPLYSFIAGINPDYYFLFHKWLPPIASLLASILVMMIFGVGAFWVYVVVLYFLGKLLGGTGKFKEVCTAYAWVYPPAYGAILLLLIGGIPKWLKILEGATELKDIVTPVGTIWFALCALLAVGFIIWCLVIMVIVISEAHKFSIGRAIGVFLIILGICLVLVALFIVVGIFAFHLLSAPKV
jgi:hypothetical protein